MLISTVSSIVLIILMFKFKLFLDPAKFGDLVQKIMRIKLPSVCEEVKDCSATRQDR